MANLKQMIVDLDRDGALAEIEARAKSGVSALDILNECKEGMSVVGDSFQAGDSFLAELVLSGEIFKAGMEILTPYLASAGPIECKGKVLFATLKGDIHYLGKGIVTVLLRAYGFEVEDVGEDVPPEVFVERMKEYKPDFVAFSSLLTPNMKEMKKAVDLMIKEGLRDDVIVLIGGGITTEQTRVFVGADFQAIDAMLTIEYCLKRVEEGK